MKKWTKKGSAIRKRVVLILLLIASFSYAMFQGGFVSWFLFYSFLPFSIYAFAIMFYPINKITIERTFDKTELRAGDTVKISLVIHFPSAFPLFFLLVEDQVRGTMTSILSFPRFQKKLELSYSIDEIPRGEHLFQGVRVKTGDFLGLIEKEYLIELEERILVYPTYQEIVYKPFENQYDQGMTTSRERVQRDTSMAVGLREYQPGDRFSWINWKATAKRNDLITKEFEQRQSHDVYIVLDCFPTKQFEVMVSFSASIIRAILRKGAQAGFLSASKERVTFPIRGGASQQQALFYHLAKINAQSTVTLDRVLNSEGFLTQQNTTLMLVTSQISKELIYKCNYFLSRKCPVILFLVKRKQEPLSVSEQSLKDSAKSVGINVVIVQDGAFHDAFSGVANQ
ncbi:DUF58 domain-containing protein [Bacillaceae bacterium Marseille-Q3522]|nr:DUF58 domain-containing protein [Bacillaceae bacterium Marseille-Q3522]